MECRICGAAPHEPSCPVRLAPGWRLPARAAPTGGPREEPPPPPKVVFRSAAPVVSREFLAARAAELRAAGHTWAAIGSALHVPLATAWDLGQPNGRRP